MNTISEFSVGNLLTLQQIDSYRDRPPILVTVVAVDGSVLLSDVPIAPYQTVANVLVDCLKVMGIEDSRKNYFGVFVYDMGESGSPPLDLKNELSYKIKRTPRPLADDEYFGDIVIQKLRQYRSFKFVVKKKLFLDDANEYPSTDMNYEKYVYLQAEKDIIIDGVTDILSESIAIELAAISMVIAFGEAAPTFEDGLIEAKLLNYIAPWYRGKRTQLYFARKMIPRIAALLKDFDLHRLYTKFITIVRSNRSSYMFGTHWFNMIHSNIYDDKGSELTKDKATSPLVTRLLKELPLGVVLGVTCKGLHLCDEEKKSLFFFSYADVDKWGGNNSQFSMVVLDHTADMRVRKGKKVPVTIELSLITTQSLDIATIMKDYLKIQKDMRELISS